MVLRRRAQHRRSADVDLFDRFRDRHAFTRNRLLEGIQIDDHQIDGRDSKPGDIREMIAVVAIVKNRAEDSRRERFHTPAENFRRAGPRGTDVTSIPASARCFAVPPVERISTFLARSAFASSMMPVLSETERSARSIRILNDARRTHGGRRANVAAGFSPNVVIEVHDVGDRVRVADGRDAKRRGAVVEV